MRKAFIILTGILFTLLFATCKQFTADIDDYLSRWSTEAFILSSTIDKKTYNDGSSIPSVASANDVTVTLKVQNHKSFQFIMPSASETRNIVEFAHFTGTKPVVSADYELKQLTADTLQLVYKADFLKNSEWGEKDVSSTITLYADDGRPPFKQTFTVPLKANTPPPLPTFTVAKTTDSPAYYVLCIKVPDMDKTVPGGLLHKDLARIEVNGAPYTFSVNEAQTAFTKPEADVFITHSDVEKLNEPDADDVPADSSWVLYYKTDVEVKDGAAKKDYTIKLIDEKGLASGIVNASTKPNKAETEIVSITKGTKISGSGSATDPAIIGTDSTGAVLSVSSATANTTVHCTVSEIGGSTPVKYDGNPATVPLPLNGVGVKQYKLEYYTDGEGFAATPVQTVYYKVVKGHTVTFDANGGAYPDSSTVVSKAALHGTTISQPDPRPKKQGFGVTGWYKDKACSAGQAWNFATDTVTGDMTLYAQWTAGADTPYKVKHYQQNVNDDNYPAAPTDTDDNATGTTGATAAVTLKNYPGFEFDKLEPASPTIAADGSTVVKVYYKRKTVHLTFNPNGGKIDGSTDNKTVSGKYGATLTAPTAQKTGYTFNSWKPEGSAPALTLTFPAADATYTAQWTANTYKVHFDKNDNAATGTMDDQLFTYDDTTKALTKNKFIKSGHTFDGWATSADGPTFYADEAQVTNLATAQDAIVTLYAKWKKARYNVTYRVEIVDDKAGGKIKADSGSFVESGSTSVEYGGSVGFTADPTNIDWEVAGWTVSSGSFESNPGTSTTATLSNVTEAKTVTVKFYQSTLKNPATWKDLARAVKSAPDNATLTINGQIQATDVANDVSRIKVQKNLTIKGENNAVLNALGKKGIFDAYKTLTLQDITLTNSTLSGSYSGGAGVYVNPSGTLIMEGSSVITDCSAANSGGGVYVGGGTFEMHGTSAITGCSANEGGGVYVSSGTFKMHGSSAIAECSAKNSGGGVHVKDGTFKMSGSAVVTPKADTPGKHENDVYLESEKTITVDSTLTGTTPVARITPRGYTAGHLYLTGNTNARHLKFTVTPEKVTEDSENWNVFWYIAADGTLKAEVEDSSLLQEVIRSRPNDTPFIIKLGNIGDLQTVEIPGNKKIMLKADRDVTLTCPNNGHDHYKHLQVQRDATLILEGKIKLQGADYGDKDHYALYVEDGGKAKIKDGVTITGFENTGRGTVFVDGNLTMSGGTITGNKARNKGDGTAYDDGKGGGVYIAPDRSFTMTGGTISDNEAGNGGGVYVSADRQQFMYGNFIMKGGTIKNNKATVSSVYSYIEYTGNGGGVCVEGYFTMKGGTITGNQSERNCKAVQAENDFHWYGGDIKDNGGANQTVSGIRAVADRNGGLYYFHNNTNPHKEPS